MDGVGGTVIRCHLKEKLLSIQYISYAQVRRRKKGLLRYLLHSLFGRPTYAHDLKNLFFAIVFVQEKKMKTIRIKKQRKQQNNRYYKSKPETQKNNTATTTTTAAVVCRHCLTEIEVQYTTTNKPHVKNKERRRSTTRKVVLIYYLVV